MKLTMGDGQDDGSAQGSGVEKRGSHVVSARECELLIAVKGVARTYIERRRCKLASSATERL